jgi:hypothetical protein
MRLPTQTLSAAKPPGRPAGSSSAARELQEDLWLLHFLYAVKMNYEACPKPTEAEIKASWEAVCRRLHADGAAGDIRTDARCADEDQKEKD